eukprot:CAMPEP_0181491934 /NCGR_PEP_ID=MMETSP1110-20121109/50409_1 /TAXON_ID=174948 /ORGANISM="Symbiodinium sp., Strain CCMP421" /LENGTH=126 /DNA_ID=CAMNT_0023619125 /DNA_START=19 /DNA_END=396 /DNA_ORIENTATION=+
MTAWWRVLFLIQGAAAQIPEGMSVSYYTNLPGKKILIWGGETGEGLEMSQFVHSRCSLLLLVGKDAQVTESAVATILSQPPRAGTCPPGVDPVVSWDSGDVSNASYVLQLTARFESALGGPPDIAW